MGILDEIQSLRREGKSDAEVTASLSQRGLSQQEISSALSQSKIKAAVQGMQEPDAPSVVESLQESPTEPSPQEYGGLTPSLMSPTQKFAQPQEQPMETQEYEQPQQQQDVYQNQNYDYAQYTPSALGSDVITEIADQVVAERLAPLTSNIDKIIDMRSSIDSQIRFMDERLKRIEKIIDRLQLSLLQRVGEYVSNVEDIKREMVETQKTFKSMLDKKQ